ncbi:hypothetical protein [Paraburkholderia phenoliruptrix]|uniref:hypothetical protein n=1 Tax=Paraburkholderia phenoliruptrix TaxID=252970 RepID=UPI003D96AC1E
MNNNVLHLPVRRKSGRPRINAIHGHGTADIVTFDRRPHSTEERLADYHELITKIVQGMLVASRAIRAFDEKYPDAPS